MNTERELLLPCPFCGGEAQRSKMMDESLWSHATVPYKKVYCPSCEIGTEYLCEGYEPTADEAWNRRASTSPAPSAAPDGWLPIESAPKDGSLFVASGYNHGDAALGRHYVIASWKNDAFKESTEWNDESTLTYLTHWMPLPAPLEHDITGDSNG